MRKAYKYLSPHYLQKALIFVCTRIYGTHSNTRVDLSRMQIFSHSTDEKSYQKLSTLKDVHILTYPLEDTPEGCYYLHKSYTNIRLYTRGPQALTEATLCVCFCVSNVRQKPGDYSNS